MSFVVNKTGFKNTFLNIVDNYNVNNKFIYLIDLNWKSSVKWATKRTTSENIVLAGIQKIINLAIATIAFLAETLRNGFGIVFNVVIALPINLTYRYLLQDKQKVQIEEPAPSNPVKNTLISETHLTTPPKLELKKVIPKEIIPTDSDRQGLDQNLQSPHLEIPGTIYLPAQRMFYQKAMDHIKHYGSALKKNGIFSYFPPTAVGLAALTGVASRFADKLPSSWTEITETLAIKNSTDCKAGFSSNALQTVNHFKQWEIKNFALLIPFIPILVNLVSKTLSERNPEEGIRGISQKFVKAVKNQVSVEQAVFLTTIVTLGLLGPTYGRTTGLTTKAFDSSGHFMLKGVLAAFLAKTLDTTSWLGIAFSLLYGLSDFVLLHKTSTACHTAWETFAGLGWGAGIYGVGRYISSFFRSNSLTT